MGFGEKRSLPGDADPTLSIRLPWHRLDRDREAPRAGRDATGNAQRVSLAKMHGTTMHILRSVYRPISKTQENKSRNSGLVWNGR